MVGRRFCTVFWTVRYEFRILPFARVEMKWNEILHCRRCYNFHISAKKRNFPLKWANASEREWEHPVASHRIHMWMPSFDFCNWLQLIRSDFCSLLLFESNRIEWMGNWTIIFFWPPIRNVWLFLVVGLRGGMEGTYTALRAFYRELCVSFGIFPSKLVWIFMKSFYVCALQRNKIIIELNICNPHIYSGKWMYFHDY